MKFNDARSQGEALTPEEIKEVPVNTMMESGSGSGSGSGSEPQYGGTQIYAGQEDATFSPISQITFYLHIWWSEGSISGVPVYADIHASCTNRTWSWPVIDVMKPSISAEMWLGHYAIVGDITYSYKKIMLDSLGNELHNEDGTLKIEKCHGSTAFLIDLNNVIEKPHNPDMNNN